MTPGARRGLIFGVWLLALEGLVFIVNRAGGLGWFTRLTAGVAGFMIDVTGVPVTVVGNEIFLDVRTLYVNAECTAVFLIALLIALVLSSDAPLRSRILGSLAGSAVILVSNIVRLVAIAHVRELSSFAFLHDIVFQVGLVALVLGTWLFWLDRAMPATARARRRNR